MAKSFKKSNPLDNIDNENRPETPAKKSKGKVGRPKTKTEETKTINIAVPVSTLDRINEVKVCFGNNLTQYINKLIENDLASNYENYKHITDSLNNFK